MVDVNVNFVLGNDEPLRADFELQPDVTYTADIKLSDATRDHTKLYNRDLPDQHPMGAITGLDEAIEAKVDKIDESSKVYGTDSDGEQTAYDVNSFGQVDDVQVGGVSVVTNKIAELGTMAGETASDYSTKAVADTLYAGISYESTIDNHIADKNNPHEVTKAQVGLGNVDNTSDSDKPISTATQTALNGKQDIISDLSTIRENASHGESAYNTISGYGDIVTHNASEFATAAQGTLADTALQPNDNISELNNDVGYITSASIPTNYVTTDTAQTITGTKTFHNCAIESDNFITLTSPNAYIRYSGSGVVRGLLRRNSSGTIEVASSNDPVKIQGSATRPAYNSSDLALYSDVTSGDSALQSQIDALVVASDVFDIVGTYAELQAYDISTVPVNDIIKVLVDETHSGAATYYRCVETGGVKSWSYIGSEGAYYTKAESDNKFVPQTRTVNSKALSSDITLTATDVGALPSSTVIPTVNDATVTIQKNGSTVSTFTLNQSSNETVNITVPTDTVDLTNGAGFITGITSGDVTTALGYTPYNSTNPSGYITGITSGDVTTALGYTPYDNTNPDGFISGITSGDVTTALGYTPYNATNPSGYITGITSGDVTTALGYTPVNSTSLASVATSGDYDDLDNLPNYGAGLSYSSSSLQLLDQNGNNLGSAVTIKSTPDLDGVTIDTNSDDELEAIGTVNKNTAVGATAVKYDWIGTLAEYNAQNVETLHPEWVCYITDDVSGGTSVYTKAEVDNAISTALTTMLDSAFPVGSRYITEASTCPLATLIPNSTWVLTSQGRVIQGADSNHASGTTAEAGLPNITGQVTPRPLNSASGAGTITSASGAFSLSQKTGGTTSSMSITSTNYGSDALTFDASQSSSIYGNSTTVQPPAEFVNIFKRTV